MTPVPVRTVAAAILRSRDLIAANGLARCLFYEADAPPLPGRPWTCPVCVITAIVVSVDPPHFPQMDCDDLRCAACPVIEAALIAVAEHLRDTEDQLVPPGTRRVPVTSRWTAMTWIIDWLDDQQIQPPDSDVLEVLDAVAAALTRPVPAR